MTDQVIFTGMAMMHYAICRNFEDQAGFAGQVKYFARLFSVASCVGESFLYSTHPPQAENFAENTPCNFLEHKKCISTS